MCRPQLRLSTLVWITLAVACWFGGMVVQRALEPDPTIEWYLKRFPGDGRSRPILGKSRAEREEQRRYYEALDAQRAWYSKPLGIAP
jgi:hypothetical protein